VTPATKKRAIEANAEAARKGLTLGVITDTDSGYFALTNAQGNVVWGGEKPPTTEEIDTALKA
jgi:hypothetical protein